MSRHPWNPYAPTTIDLHFCVDGNDWWAFLHVAGDKSCPVHGPSATRIPHPGSDVTGPCLTCGRVTVVEEYDPRRHNDESCLRCGSCREATR